MRYTSEVQEERDARSGGQLGFPWVAAIAAGATIGSQVLGLFRENKQRDYASRIREQEQRLRLLSQQAQAEIARLRQTLPDRLSEAEAQRILQTGAETEYQQALQTWRRRFSGLPNASQLAETVAAQVRSAYLSAAQQTTGRTRLKAGAGWLLGLAGAGLGAYAILQQARDKK